MRIAISFLAGLFMLMAGPTSAQADQKTLVKDFLRVIGSWKGSLTYLDYSSGKPYTMEADMEIGQIGNTSQFIFSNIYPKEMNANSVDTMRISADGKFINGERIRSRTVLPNGAVELVTEEMGKDGNDNKPATFRHTYTFGDKILKLRKDVQFTGDKEWINRHEYSYKR